VNALDLIDEIEEAGGSALRAVRGDFRQARVHLLKLACRLSLDDLLRDEPDIPPLVERLRATAG
jgi:hypothetical protein